MSDNPWGYRSYLGPKKVLTEYTTLCVAPKNLCINSDTQTNHNSVHAQYTHLTSFVMRRLVRVFTAQYNNLFSVILPNLSCSDYTNSFVCKYSKRHAYIMPMSPYIGNLESVMSSINEA